jgi:hypothetical protein
VIQWFEFTVAVILNDPETRCSVCGIVTFNSWRTGFCGWHNTSTVPSRYDELPDGSACAPEADPQSLACLQLSLGLLASLPYKGL